MHYYKIDTLIGFFSGAFGGFIKYLSLLDAGFGSRLFEAGSTALVCGFLGVAGKHSFDWLRKKYLNKNKKP